MRRILSIAISLIIVFMSVSNGIVAYASMSAENGLNSFAESLIDMIREYDKNSDYDITDSASVQQFYGSATGEAVDYNGFSEDDFSSSRLVVKASELTDYYGAIDCVSGYNDLYILQYDSPEAAINAFTYFNDCDEVKYVEPDFEFSTDADVFDELPTEEIVNNDVPGEFDEAAAEAVEWLSDKIGFSEIKSELEGKIADDYVLVAVIDSGVDLDHELLQDRIVDGNVNLSMSGEKNSSDDDYGHGTHVAGIIVNNTLDNVKIKPYKVLNRDGLGSLSAIALAVEMATADGVDVINLSLSGEAESQRMTEAIDNAVANDINVVAAAGNKSLDLDNNYVSPACVESAITVSATDRYDNLADFSNYDGPIDIAAPGVNIESSYMGNTYLSMSGTSMAAPQVTAGIAILQTVMADKPAAECEKMIKDYAKKLKENEGENHFGAGLLFLKYILEEEKPVTPDPVFSVEGCDFKTSFNLTLSCEDADAKIYYLAISPDELDFSSLKQLFKVEKIEDIEEFVLYKSPIKITVNVFVIAVARSDGKELSSFVINKYTRVSDNEEDFYEINSSGYITGYFGSDTDIVIPNKINGKTVKGIAVSAFENNTKLTSVYLPDSAVGIKGLAFSGCTSLVSVSGKNVTEIGSRSFEGSSIQKINLPKLNKVGASAFLDCESLSEITLDNVQTIGNNAFENTKVLKDVTANKLSEIGMYAFKNSGITAFSSSTVTKMGNYAFSECESLISVSIPCVDSISIGAFNDCISLKTIDMSGAETIGANAFANSGVEEIDCNNIISLGSNAFDGCEYLTKVNLPNLTTLNAGGLSGCPALQYVSLPSLTQLRMNSFKDSEKLEYLYLPQVVGVDRNAFNGSYVKYLQFDNAETINSLPVTLEGIMLPSVTTEVTEVPETDYTVYGYTGTYAEEYANENNKQFSPIPAIVFKSTDIVSVDEQYISICALGTNCQYQWYRNTTVSNEGGTAIDGATNNYYEPSPDDNSAAYYCVVYCTDGINENTMVSEPIENAPEYRDADYTEYNILYEQYQNIDRRLYDEEKLKEIDALFAVDVSDYSLAEQDELNSLVADISKKIIDAEIKYILCDINNDGKISVLDARLALKAVVGSYNLNKIQTLAADVNSDGKISIADSRAILKSVLDQ